VKTDGNLPSVSEKHPPCCSTAIQNSFFPCKMRGHRPFRRGLLGGSYAEGADERVGWEQPGLRRRCRNRRSCNGAVRQPGTRWGCGGSPRGGLWSEVASPASGTGSERAKVASVAEETSPASPGTGSRIAHCKGSGCGIAPGTGWRRFTHTPGRFHSVRTPDRSLRSPRAGFRCFRGNIFIMTGYDLFSFSPM
jgi:hypothetical protein